jgi:hypothetical protein
MFVNKFHDLLVLIFQTRDIRGGKGERDLFTNMMTIFLNTFPEHSYSIVKLIPEYGCWKDLWKLYDNVIPLVQKSIDKVVKEQFDVDVDAEKPSLLAKWLPREGRKFNSLAHHFAKLLTPRFLFEDTQDDKERQLRAYRQNVSYLSEKIDTTEIKMCGKRWASIVPKHVPGRLLKKNKRI